MNLTFARSYRAGVFIDRDTEIMRIQIFCSLIPKNKKLKNIRPIPLTYYLGCCFLPRNEILAHVSFSFIYCWCLLRHRMGMVLYFADSMSGLMEKCVACTALMPDGLWR